MKRLDYLLSLASFRDEPGNARASSVSLRSELCSKLGLALVILVGSVSWWATQPVNAAPIYSGSINNNGTLETVPSSLNSVVLSDYTSIVDNDPGGNSIGLRTTGVDAVASYGRLQVSTFADYLNTREFFPIFSGSGTGGQSYASFLLDDLIITGPPGNFLMSFNIALTGGAFATAGTTNAMYGAAEARASLNLQSSFGGGGADLGYLGVDSSGTHVANGIFSTFPANANGAFVGTTPEILTYAGDTAVRFGLGIETRAVATVGYGAQPGSSYGSSNFFHTFGFPTSGPVANLPAGYTLNSASGHIVNNRFVVPEPGAIALAGSSVIVLVSYLRFRNSRR